MTRFVGQLRRRLRLLREREAVDRELDEEMRFHLEMEIADRVRSGMAPGEARRTAMRDFGGVERYKEEVREVRGLGWLSDLRQDVRFGLRGLGKNPGFAAVALVTLAVGIGVNTAIFSVVHGTLLRGLPYPDADRVVAVWERDERGTPITVTGPNFEDWQELSRSFEAMAAHASMGFVGGTTVLGADAPVRAEVVPVTRDFFRVLGVEPALGRGFGPDETTPGGPLVAIVSHSFWRDFLGGDPSGLGRSLNSGAALFEVVGVMPAWFSHPRGAEIWVSLEAVGGVGTSRTAHNWEVVGRLRSGVAVADAESELTRITGVLREEYGGAMTAHGAATVRLQDQLVGELRTPLLMLFGAAGLVLLLACANLASGFLARGSTRSHEVAIRTSLGASRTRLLRQLFTESLLVAVAGAVAGLVVAALLLRALLVVGPTPVAQSGSWGLDPWVLGFTLTLAMVSAILFGLMPAVRSSTAHPGDALRRTSRGSSVFPRRAWGFLVGTQAALAVLLLVGSGLLIQSLRQVLGTDRGFETERVLTMEVSVPEAGYQEDRLIAGFYRSLQRELASIPGVEHVGMIHHLPLGGHGMTGNFEIEGRGLEGSQAGYRIVGGDYLRAMGIPLLRGRFFDDRDHGGAGHVAVINRTLAERVWPGEDPVGQRIRNLANDSWIYPDEWVTIVGVIGDVRHRELLAEAGPEIYVHYLQRPARARSAVVVMRAGTPTGELVAAARARTAALDGNVPVSFATMGDRVLASVADRRFTTLVLAGFALAALLLAAVGIYGVVSYTVARRTREIGIRLALGGRPEAVRRLVQRHAMVVVLGGVAVGVVGALSAASVLHGMLYGVRPTDPLPFLAAVVVLTGVAWLASWIPARRTTRVDPMIALRSE